MSKDIRVEGLEEVFDLVDRVVDPELIKRALGKCCALVERTAKENAPKDTGDLRRSITSKVEDNVGIVYTPLEYAPYVEYGTGLFAVDGGRLDVPWNYQDDQGQWHSTSGQKPQPFMKPALDTNRLEIKRILEEVITND